VKLITRARRVLFARADPDYIGYLERDIWPGLPRELRAAVTESQLPPWVSDQLAGMTRRRAWRMALRWLTRPWEPTPAIFRAVPYGYARWARPVFWVALSAASAGLGLSLAGVLPWWA